MYDAQGGTHTVTAQFTRTSNNAPTPPAEPTSTWSVQMIGEDDGDPLTPLPTIGPAVDIDMVGGKVDPTLLKNRVRSRSATTWSTCRT